MSPQSSNLHGRTVYPSLSTPPKAAKISTAPRPDPQLQRLLTLVPSSAPPCVSKAFICNAGLRSLGVWSLNGTDPSSNEARRVLTFRGALRAQATCNSSRARKIPLAHGQKAIPIGIWAQEPGDIVHEAEGSPMVRFVNGLSTSHASRMHVADTLFRTLGILHLEDYGAL